MFPPAQCFDGGFAIGDRAWVVDADAECLLAHDHSNGTLTRNSTNDVSLPTVVPTGGFDIGDRAWVVDLDNDKLLAYELISAATYNRFRPIPAGIDFDAASRETPAPPPPLSPASSPSQP